jgi:hypothetical protein
MHLGIWRFLRWRQFSTGALILHVLLLGGCATQAPSLSDAARETLPRRTELASVPFFPQERYQCGPAALAMSLTAAGLPVEPEALVSQVYIPAREGSLQPEMLAAGRRHGAVSTTIPSHLEALLAEIAAGTPVIVLQNLSLPWFPLWHYAVAIGYDLDDSEIVLRSGTTKREVMKLSTFLRTWSRGGNWAMVTVPVERLPFTVEQSALVKALVAFEKSANPARVRTAYKTALERWPKDLTLQLGYGNAAYAEGDRSAAIAAFHRATEDHPESAPAFNNLAALLAEEGQIKQALQAAERAVALGGPWHEEAQATLDSIRKKQHDTQ